MLQPFLYTMLSITSRAFSIPAKYLSLIHILHIIIIINPAYLKEVSIMDKKPGNTTKPRGSALIPFLVFIFIYLGAGIILQSKGVEMAFYQFPAPVAILIAVMVAFAMFKGSMDEKLADFIKGCGDENILTMCFIYLFAGAFASVASAMGGVEATSNLGLSIIPAEYILSLIHI